MGWCSASLPTHEMLASSRFWRLTVWGLSLYGSWLTNLWRIWVKCWEFIKYAVVAFFLLIGVRFAFGRLATQAGEPADRATAGAQHHPHGDYTEVSHCTNNHAVMHVCTSLTCILANFCACISYVFYWGSSSSFIFAKYHQNICIIFDSFLSQVNVRIVG